VRLGGGWGGLGGNNSVREGMVGGGGGGGGHTFTGDPEGYRKEGSGYGHLSP